MELTMNATIKRAWPFAMLLVLCGCSSQNVPTTEIGHVLQSVTVDVGTQIPGYVHDISRSRFRIGTNTLVELNGPTLKRWRGSLGAFAVDPSNGWSMALLDATSSTGPYITDEPTQRAAVKAYFIDAGLPADQIGNVLATYRHSGSVPRSTSTPPQIDDITSVLTRIVNGIRVPESYAGAKMTTSGDVDMESVFWPPLDVSIVNAASSFAASMSDAQFHATFVAKLPETVHTEIGVVIHHTSLGSHSAPVAYVAYDAILDPSGSVALRHFDVNGAEFRLPQEATSSPVVGGAKP
jgi:hypothetical protein